MDRSFWTLGSCLLACLLACGTTPESTDGSTSGASTTAGPTETETGTETTTETTGDPGVLAPPGEFLMLTYNVAGLPQGISSSNPEVNIPQISPLLNAYDLVLAQEDFYYHAELSADVTHPYQTAPYMDPPDIVDLGDGLNRFSQFPMDGHERAAWYDCNGGISDCASDCLATKGWSFARTTIDANEVENGVPVEIDIYNLHMEAGGCDKDVEIRLQSAHDLVAEINQRSEGRAVIVAGDFNLRETDPEDVEPLMVFLGGAKLYDSCTELDCGDLRIDKVMYRSGENVELEPLLWEVPPEFVDLDGADLSDHKPVAVSFAYTPK